jgi:uncharacterized OsmC-like protein
VKEIAMKSREEIKAALERATRTVTQRPSVGQRIYVNTAVVEDGLACRIKEKNHVLTADLPPSMGGDDSGPSPSTLLRAALSSCVAMGVKMWAARKDVVIDRVEVTVETDVDARGQFGVADEVAPGFEDVRVRIHVDSPADPGALRDIVDMSLRYSPLMDAFRQTQAVATHLTVGHRVLEQQ